MSFRVEQKLYIKKENLFDFKSFLNKKSAKGIHELGPDGSRNLSSGARLLLGPNLNIKP